MTLRGKLTAVAAGLLGSFVSRNNDVDGYWALGQLRSLSDTLQVPQIRFDLMLGTAMPDGVISRRVAAAYREALLRQLRCRAISIERLSAARVLLDFAPGRAIREDSFASYGEPFTCIVEIEDERGRIYTRSYAGRCAPHDRLENKSSRA